MCRRALPGELRLFLITVAVFTAIHAVLAATVPLAGDETYYWECSRHPDWSYFDQPPLVIWAMIPFRALLGETALAVRGPALLASLLIAVFLLPIARRLGGGPREAAGAYLLLHATPVFFLGSFYASTDVAMVAAFLAGTWAAIALAQGEVRAWYGFALAIGLGFLAKFPAVLMLPALLPVLAARHDGRRWGHLATPHPYLAGGLAALLTAPVWVWAFRHDFDNIWFQLAKRHTEHRFTFLHVVEFLVSNLILFTPFLLAGIAIALGRRWREADPAWRVVVVAALAPLAFFALVALRTRVGAHWGAPGLIVGVIALAMTAFRRRRVVLALGWASGLLFVAAALATVFNPGPLLNLQWSYRGRPETFSTSTLARLVGNEAIVAEVRARRAPGELVASESYTTAHQLAFLSGGALETRLAHVLDGRHGLASLYWYSPDELRGRDVLFVTERPQVEERLRIVFASVAEEPPLEISLDGRVVRRVHFFRCRNLLHPESVFTRLGERRPFPWEAR